MVPPLPSPPRLRVVFFGSPAFAVPSLEAVAGAHDVALVVSQPDKPAGRGGKLTAPAVKTAAERLGLPVWQPPGVRGADVLERLRALVPDVFVVVAYGRILPQALLDVPRLGPWNVHASLLPRLRGAAPIQWAIIRGDARTGVSIMRMEAGLDTGPVAAQAEIAIAADDDAATLAVRLAPLGARLLADTLPRIAAGAVALAPQDDAAATLAPILTKEDGHLDFTRPAHDVSARARGVDPWPGAFARLGGESIKLFGPRPARDGAPGATPGQILRIDAEGMAVACADGAVSFAEVQLPGRKRMAASAAAAGRAVAPGMLLA